MIYGTAPTRKGLRASWNPGMSEPNPAVQRALYFDPAAAFHGGVSIIPGFDPAPPVPVGTPRVAGLHGIRGLNFSYRLNQWGPKMAPAMLPANTSPYAYTPNNPSGGLSGLSGPLSWVESLFGVESIADTLTDASNNVNTATDALYPTQAAIQTLLSQAQAYSGSTDATVQQKSQACQAEAAGLISAMSNLQSAAGTLITAIQNGQAPNSSITSDAATDLKQQSAALLDQVNTFVKSIGQLKSDVLDLAKYAQSGPSTIQAIENSVGATVKSSVSTLTWILGGGALVYFLAPSFIPRLASGIRKARG